MIIGDESNDIEEFKEGDCVILNHLLKGTVKYISKMGFAEVFFKTDCGGGYIPVSLKENIKNFFEKTSHFNVLTIFNII